MNNDLKLDRWYDRSTRSWIVRAVDAEGNQIGDAIYVATKGEALAVKLSDFRI
jgi:hypothetical protein